MAIYNEASLRYHAENIEKSLKNHRYSRALRSINRATTIIHGAVIDDPKEEKAREVAIGLLTQFRNYCIQRKAS